MKIRVLYFISTFVVTTALVVGLASYVSPEFNSYVLHKSAPLEWPGLEFRLGDLYFKGVGQSRDLKKAEQWYLKAAKAGYAKAMYKLGNLYSHRVGMQKGAEKNPDFWGDIPLDYQKAIEWYAKAAEKRYAQAYTRLGYFNLEGVGGLVDYPQSFFWYRKAAKIGRPRSQAWLGFFYSHGIGSSHDWIVEPSCWNGMEKNYAKALKWYERAARQGLAWAQYKTGFMYTHGEECLKREPRVFMSSPLVLQGVRVDYANAKYWFERAADQGDECAQRWLGWLYYRGNYALPQDYKMAFYWYSKAADNGDAISMRRVGSCYEDGTGVSRSRARALDWYRRASAAGDCVASQYLKNWAATGHS